MKESAKSFRIQILLVSLTCLATLAHGGTTILRKANLLGQLSPTGDRNLASLDVGLNAAASQPLSFKDVKSVLSPLANSAEKAAGRSLLITIPPASNKQPSRKLGLKPEVVNEIQNKLAQVSPGTTLQCTSSKISPIDKNLNKYDILFVCKRNDNNYPKVIYGFYHKEGDSFHVVSLVDKENFEDNAHSVKTQTNIEPGKSFNVDIFVTKNINEIVDNIKAMDSKQGLLVQNTQNVSTNEFFKALIKNLDESFTKLGAEKKPTTNKNVGSSGAFYTFEGTSLVPFAVFLRAKDKSRYVLTFRSAKSVESIDVPTSMVADKTQKELLMPNVNAIATKFFAAPATDILLSSAEQITNEAVSKVIQKDEDCDKKMIKPAESNIVGRFSDNYNGCNKVNLLVSKMDFGQCSFIYISLDSSYSKFEYMINAADKEVYNKRIAEIQNQITDVAKPENVPKAPEKSLAIEEIIEILNGLPEFSKAFDVTKIVTTGDEPKPPGVTSTAPVNKKKQISITTAGKITMTVELSNQKFLLTRSSKNPTAADLKLHHCNSLSIEESNTKDRAAAAINSCFAAA